MSTIGSDYTNDDIDYFTNLTPLYQLVEDRNWTKVVSLCNSNSTNDAATWVSRKGKDGSLTWRRLPLHEACIRFPSEEAIVALLASYPDGVRGKDQNGRLPLHHACVHGASVDVVEKLLMAFPESIEVEDVWGKTPVSTGYASASPNKNQVVRLLEKPVSYFHAKLEDEKRAAIEEKLKEGFEEKLKVAERKHKSVLSMVENELLSERMKSAALEQKLESNKLNEKMMIEKITMHLAKFEEGEKMIKALKGSELSLKDTIKYNNKEIFNLLEKNKALEIRIKDDTESIEDLRKALHEEKMAKETLREELETNQTNLSNLKIRLATSEATMKAKDSTIATLEETKTTLECTINNLNDKIEASLTTLQTRDSKIQSDSETIQLLQKTQSDLEQCSKDRIVNLENKIKDDAKVISDLKVQLAKLDVSTSKTITALKKEASQKDAIISNNDESIAKLTNTLTTTQDKTNDYERTIQHLQDSIATLAYAKGELETKMKKDADSLLGMKVASNADASEIQILKRDLNDKTSIISHLESQLGEYGLKFADLSSRLGVFVRKQNELLETTEECDKNVQLMNGECLRAMVNTQRVLEERMTTVVEDSRRMVDNLRGQTMGVEEVACELEEWLSSSSLRS